jgi:hypothetical protein
LKRIIIILVILGYFGAVLLLTLGLGFYWFITKRTPDQPITFSHAIHASKLNIACLHCHRYVEKSRHAGAPSVQKCMDCHKKIATDRAEIKKLTQYYQEENPIEWTQVYTLPDHVYFSHKRHVKAGLNCSMCHGDVAVMKKIRKVSSLEMGWCVSCHQDRNAPLDCTTCHH